MCELCRICGCVFRCVRDGVHGCVNCVEPVDVYSVVPIYNWWCSVSVTILLAKSVKHTSYF